MAKYKMIADTLKERIKKGQYLHDNRLPDQSKLSEEFETSRVTIKKALDVLTNEGLIYTIQGSGSYVKKNALLRSKNNIKIGKNLGLTTLVENTKDIRTEVLGFSVRFPNETEQTSLIISRDTPVYSYERLRYLEGKPYSLEKTTIPVESIPGLSKKVLQGSVYSYIKENMGLVFGEYHQAIRAAKPDEEDLKYLNNKLDEPVLEVEKVLYLETGIPFEYSLVHHRYDMVEMSFINNS